MHRKNVRSLALILCTLTYLVLGAAVFDALESETDNKHRQVLSELRERLQRKYNFTKEDYKIFEAVAIKSIPHKAGRQWKFSGAFYFATLVITMVGYGHSTPDTFFGKLFCIIYALCGIPLGLVMFQSIGERYESWSLFESYYYCFITLTTIGFGDYVALQKPGMLENDDTYVIFTLTFILFGLAIFSAADAGKEVMLESISNELDDSNSDVNDPLNEGRTPNKLRLSSATNQLIPIVNSRKLSSQSAMSKTHNQLDDDPLSGFYLPRTCNRRNCSMRNRILQSKWAQCLGLDSCFGNPRGDISHSHYTVRRGPCRISHLVETVVTANPRPEDIAHSPVENQAFIMMQDMGKDAVAIRRRPSL